MNMHDQFMGMTTIQQPLLSCLPAFYALAIPMSCYISNVFLLLVYSFIDLQSVLETMSIIFAFSMAFHS